MIDSVSELIEALGGTMAVAQLIGVGRTAVSNWRVDRFIPKTHFLTLAKAARERGFEAPEHLFGTRRERMVSGG